MKTWEEFVESKKEKQEEKTGIDLDCDKEKGESAKHKAKVEATQKEMLEFFKKRKESAAKIASQAKSKGGPSILTYWHFAAKNKPYNEVIKFIKAGNGEKQFMSKCTESLSRIHCGKMTQKKFQEVMGEAEVWGEALTKIFH